MTLTWRDHPGARAELLEAYDHYADIDDGALGDQFIDAVESAAELILGWPDGAPPYRGVQRAPAVRSWHLGKFPYRLIYIVRAGEVFVLAYAHESRKPGYWTERLRH
ncbi:type II toxin-antitoxin system RelE/ParE family toxin [Brachybacterium atlanticum]|uniref:type II toxin-antitoxin system RelE/ParE family toxin n=1 Tax=Brachybacterium atlanticum TaxID=2911888 RepID=UPI0021E08DD2|nr:type II toxin-antitoxin system RelE/ParE family toxin [Brachybacterium atlanticum]